ncbi:MAG: bifunctional biotin--[acetyl-CoA-carboxylase] synthetase/biotin operon repressor, partial [Cyanobacteria bacterium REEB65]|nr:bifunctional biotin--[acetyl-CoA-carboxylase] synthetase/biotin operon repressor [Cyanobacteria bacterium REEB65]
RKIGGILAEVSHRRFVLLGIGVNLKPVNLPEVASLQEAAAGRPVDRLELAESIVAQLAAALAQWRESGAGPILAAWRSRCVTLGRDVQVQAVGRVLVGRAEDIDPEGRLRLRLPDGSYELVSSGTVRLADGSYA